MLKESSKQCLIFFYFYAIFEKSVNMSHQELSLSHILMFDFLRSADN